MRFTKIPLIATLMAVALSLLIVLPTLAQVSGDRTDGRLSAGDWIDVRVADNIDDLNNTPDEATPAPANIGNNDDAWATATGGGAFNARDTYFDGTLYVSNKDDAYNTILITAKVSGTGNLQASGPSGRGDDAATEDNPDTPAVENDESVVDCYDSANGGVAIATVRNSRSNTPVTAFLFPTNEDEGGTEIYQGVVAILDQEDAIGPHNGPCAADQVEPELYLGSGEQILDADRDIEPDPVDDPATENVNERTVAIRGYNDPGNDDGWTHASMAVLPARDGDTLTITVKGVSGSVRLVVDGAAPEIEDVSPASGGTQSSTSIDLGFTVSDDGSGIRYDGESGVSGDPDLTPHNGDRDQRFDEPITKVGAGQDLTTSPPTYVAGDGSTEDIMVLYDDDDSGMTMQYLINTNCANGGTQTSEAQCESGGTTYDNDSNSAYTGYLINFDAADDVSAYGSNGWTQGMRGVTYDLDMRLVGQGFGEYFWQVTAKDRVGNMAITDSDEDDPGAQPYSFKVDDEGPMVPDEGARTGIGYEPGEGEFKSRSWIALRFVNEDQGDADRIDAGTVEPGDFTVEGHTVMSVVVPSDKKVCKEDDPATEEEEDAKNIDSFDSGCDFEPRARIYLELADALDSDETPTIQLLGGVFKDIAGNNNVTQSLENVQDKIAPGVSITITSDSGATGRTATDDEGSFTVRVTSDEDLRTFPRLFFATLEGEADVDDGVGGTASNLVIREATTTPPDGKELTEKESNVWEKSFEDDDIEGDDDRIVAVVITAEDEEGNSGNSAGWKDSDSNGIPSAGDSLDFKKLDAGGFLLEIDSALAAAEIEVLPSTDPGEVTDETESPNPYIQITFSEQDEYGIRVTDDKGTTAENAPAVGDPDYDANYDPTDDDERGTSRKIDIGDGDTARTDSHRSVEITAITLNGNDMLADIVQVDPWKYVLAVTGLEIGEYELVYSARDDVGNDVEDEDETFEVLERQPYDIELQPGWNLISLPGDPFNPAVGSVIGADLRADTVLGYQGGEWVTAVKNDDGRWQGTLVDIVGGYGYWVRTTAVETIEVVIPPILPTSNLPTVPVVSGWNLLGVVDADQTNIGNEGDSEDADEYFTSLNTWRVAYSFATQQNQWSKLLPGQADHMVENGKGYWVWVTRPGTLVP